MPDSLLFDTGGDDRIRFTTPEYSGTGAFTWVAILKRLTDSTFREFMSHDMPGSNTTFFYFRGKDNNLLEVTTGPTDNDSTIPFAIADGWVLAAFSKPAGSSVGRFHRYKYSTSSWTHSAGTVAVVSPSTAAEAIYIGHSIDTANEGLNMNMLIAGVWDSELSDLTIETLNFNKPAWVTAAPDAAWRLDTMSAITPLTGTGVEDTTTFPRVGTSLDVGDAPVGWSDEVVEDTFPSDNPPVGFLGRGAGW